MPGGDAVPAVGLAVGTDVFGMDQAVHLLPSETASQGHGRTGGACLFDGSGRAP